MSPNGHEASRIGAPSPEAEIEVLCERFVGGGTTAEGLVDALFPLWRSYRDTPASLNPENDWIDRVMTAADCYSHPHPTLRLSEAELRFEVAKHLERAS